MIRKNLFVIFAILLSSTAIGYEGKERIVWSKKPINVVLNVGEERVIHFPSNIEHWLPDALSSVVVVQTVSNTFYIKAIKPFPKMRLRFRELESGKIYLLDFKASHDEEVADEITLVDKSSTSKKPDKVAVDPEPSGVDWRVRLTRYAAQSLYAPERVIEADRFIRQAPIEPGVEIPLVRGGKVKAETVASWRGGSWFVHAVKLTNITSDPVELDPRNAYRGEWSTATAQHSELGAKALLGGMDSDTAVTTVYLTSQQAFAESLGWGD